MSQDDFGTFRAMLQRPTLESHWELYHLIKRAADRDLERYTEVWLPYLNGFPHHLTEPFQSFWDFESIVAACDSYPGCPFALRISGNPDVELVLYVAERCRLVRLELSGMYMNPPPEYQLQGKAIRTLLNSPHLRHLTHLDLSFNLLRTEGAESLEKSPYLSNVTHLNLSGCRLNGAAIAQLVASPHLTNLVELELGHNELDDDACEALSNSPNMAKLTRLDLDMMPLGDRAAMALATSPHITRLTRLSVSNNSIGAAGVEALVGSPNAANLGHLRLWSTAMGDDGALAIARSPHLGNLTDLDIGKSDLTTQGLLDVLHGEHLTSLERLSATYINFPPPSFEHDLAPRTSASHPATLLELDLECAKLGDVGVVALAASDRLASLKQLDLSENGFADAGAIALAESPHLNRLSGLSMHSGDGNWPNAIGVDGARAPAESPHLVHRGWTSLDTDAMGDEGVDLLLDSDHFSEGIKNSILADY